MITRRYVFAMFLGLSLGQAAVMGCSLLTPDNAKTAMDVIQSPAGKVLTKVIRDRFGAEVDPASGVCWELPEGFASGDEDMDDNERGAFIMCWASGKE